MTDQKSSFWQTLKLPLYFLFIIWAIHLSQVFLGFNFYGWGLYPREVFGLKGILTSPLLHKDFGHLINNSIPFLVVGIFMLLFYRRVAMKSFVLIYILTGLAVWIFARPSFHIGASGVVYGMVAFVFWNGIFRRNIRSIAISLVIFFLYSGMIAGVFPVKEGVSWESHLLGALVGIFVSYMYKEEIEESEKPQPASWELEDESKKPFLRQDTFDMTLRERQEWVRRQQQDWNQDHSGNLD
jgi:membrane associated rhomboid family serine protease